MSVFDLEGRKALVTGGAKGLGAGMAEALAKAGASVMIGDVLEDEGRATAEAVGSGGVKTGFVKLDVTDDANWEEAVAATAETLGGFDILVNNAGIEISSLVVDLDPNDIRRMCEVNILGTALGTKHGLRSMRPGGVAGTGGSVINISSVAATIPFPGISGYSATKSAVDRFPELPPPSRASSATESASTASTRVLSPRRWVSDSRRTWRSSVSGPAPKQQSETSSASPARPPR